MATPLKLRAVDADDLAVLGACLQDALAPIQAMRFIGEENRFVMVANRFCWEKLAGAEKAESTSGSYERVHCGITFEHVKKVEARADAVEEKEAKANATIAAYEKKLDALDSREVAVAARESELQEDFDKAAEIRKGFSSLFAN